MFPVDLMDFCNEAHKSRILLAAIIIFGLLLTLYVQIPSLRNDQIVQDDARQHLYWMARFADGELFENDFLTERLTNELEIFGARFVYYPRSIGFSFIYFIAHFFMDPLLFNKILPFVLAALCIYYAFKLGLLISGFGGAFLLAYTFIVFNLNPSSFSISQGLQRSFAYPLLLAFTYYLIGKKFIRSAITIIVGLISVRLKT